MALAFTFAQVGRQPLDTLYTSGTLIYLVDKVGGVMGIEGIWPSPLCFLPLPTFCLPCSLAVPCVPSVVTVGGMLLHTVWPHTEACTVRIVRGTLRLSVPCPHSCHCFCLSVCPNDLLSFCFLYGILPHTNTQIGTHIP